SSAGSPRWSCNGSSDAQAKKNPQPELGVLGKDPGDDLLSHAGCTLPSARARFTSEFGMGSGGSTQLLSPGRGWRVAVGGCRRAHALMGWNVARLGANVTDASQVQGHLRLYGQATRIISTG